jgi:V/A-type H+/Na+-transporting ATPase subunit E
MVIPMNDQLKAIIDKIKQDGIKNASEKADEIISNANDKAKQIIADAEKRKQEIISNAEKEAMTFQTNGRYALEQAGRDVLLHIRKKLTVLFEHVIKDKIKQQYKPEIVTSAISTVMKNWSASEYKQLNILIPDQELASLKTGLEKALADALTSGTKLTADANLPDGFRITEKNGSYYYDFSSDSIAGLLSEYLTKELSELLEKAAGDTQ